MVKAGLKVGDTFEDGGRTYTVTKVLPNGCYVSTAKAYTDEPVVKEETDEPEVKEETVEPVVEDSKPTKRTSKAK